jgi:hypothetical protein
VSNDALWEKIEDSPPFQDVAGDPDRRKAYDRAWAWLELLREGRGLTQLQVIRLSGLLDAVYEAGKADGAQK